MINFDYDTEKITKQNNPNWFQIHDHSYKILLIGLIQINWI